ncbi:Coiled-coil domain-containing protein [Trichinella pseudospiralis]|uniref:Coiled-coil domain-containing protein n=2 Tax=Trichinella pseudospiralis TaxID=6337 RepID=A0A0V1JVX6_TRIPS|nr:Coiled-coil domain-containing protein [Trichinella pseudospiralis]KRY86942.1 Coiled-coil domain-containing protein [Trichinella pseudospiralis]KRZ21865.1 Coiled-coil domain-containing protein [Trichinella pseudospiralis]KRZ39134.1 Coiled-coil domain-containing protein [Trichinella pseudospiralis]
MPKKWVSENSKAVAARNRKLEAQKIKQEREQKEIEDSLWQEHNKNVLKKLERKEDRERRKQEIAQRKQANRLLLEKEMEEMNGKCTTATKVTRASIAAFQEKEKQKLPNKAENRCVTLNDVDRNVNHLTVEGEEARTVDDAIMILSDKMTKVDLHPEKRMRAAFAAFQERNLPLLKKENPTLRQSQLMQRLKKEWQKSADNPMNQS